MNDASIDPLSGGFYPVGEAARLLRVGGTRRVRRWVVGDRRSEPVVANDYDPLGGALVLSFLDLIEVRFLDHFRRAGVPLQTLRRAAVTARREMGVRHPFALSDIRFSTDRRRIFAQAAEEAGDERTWDLATRQYEMYAMMEASLAQGVSFAPRTGLAESFRPLPEFTNVVAHPRFAFGKPTIGDRRAPTAALARLWRAEHGDARRVAAAFEIDVREVEEAVRFEAALAA